MYLGGLCPGAGLWLSRWRAESSGGGVLGGSAGGPCCGTWHHTRGLAQQVWGLHTEPVVVTAEVAAGLRAGSQPGTSSPPAAPWPLQGRYLHLMNQGTPNPAPQMEKLRCSASLGWGLKAGAAPWPVLPGGVSAQPHPCPPAAPQQLPNSGPSAVHDTEADPAVLGQRAHTPQGKNSCLSKYFILGDPSKKTLHIRQTPQQYPWLFFWSFLYFFLFKSTKTI